MTHVLIVDDKEENLYYLQVLLTGHGCTVAAARHGAEALVMARQMPPDVIISDLLMPVMDGYTLLYQWKSDARLKRIPFIVYTATYTEAEDERLALSLGADAFILKPTEPEDFLARLYEVQARAAANIPEIPHYPSGDETENFKLYSETLIRKLEEKTFQLEEANQKLQADIADRHKIEIALRASEAELRLLTETMPQLVWMARPDGWNFHFNQRWMDYTGLSLEASLGRQWIQLFHPDDQGRAGTVWQQAMTTGEAYEIEYRLRRSDGAYRWMLGRALPLRDTSGEIVKWFGTCTDIDELKRVEERAQSNEREQRDLAAQLEAERERLVAAQAVAKLGSWETDLSSFSVLWSQETCRIFEFTPENLRLSHQRFLDLVHPDDRMAVQEAFVHSFESRSPHAIEHRLLMPDGRIKIVEERWQIVFDERGQKLRATGTCQDITERKRTEAQRDRFFTMSLDMLCISDMSGDFTRVNPAFSEILGFTETEFMARPFLEWVHPDDRAATLAIVEQLTHGKPAIGFENRYRTKDGSWRWLEWKAAAVPEEGAIYAAARDVTDRRESEVELRRVRDELEVRVQERTVELKQTNAELQFQIVEKEEAESEIRELNSQLKLANLQLKTENTERLIAMGALREIAQSMEQARGEAEQARENAEMANRAKSEFLSRMSHELRTPLNAILGFGQILEMRNSDGDPQERENIRLILQAGRHLLSLINEVLDIARIEAGHLSLSPEPVDLALMVREVLNLVRPLAANRQIVLLNEVRGDARDLCVLADQQRIKQVLLNLLSNAVKYNREAGTVTITSQPQESRIPATLEAAQTAREVSGARHLRISVRDTGPGLTPEEMARLFEPFERLGAARSQIEGTGIGLSLCKRLVAAMNGRIGVESTVGTGSTFWIEIPLVNGAMTTDEVDATPANPEPHRGPTQLAPILDGQRTVVYIEDNLSNIHLIERVMEGQEQQIRLLPAMQGSLGLELATQHLPDLILLDVNLPDIGGDEVLERLKANPVTKEIPVVILSADATNRQIERLLKAGASHYLTKPLDLEQFYSVLEETLRPKRT